MRGGRVGQGSACKGLTGLITAEGSWASILSCQHLPLSTLPPLVQGGPGGAEQFPTLPLCTPSGAPWWRSQR